MEKNLYIDAPHPDETRAVLKKMETLRIIIMRVKKVHF